MVTKKLCDLFYYDSLSYRICMHYFKNQENHPFEEVENELYQHFGKYLDCHCHFKHFLIRIFQKAIYSTKCTSSTSQNTPFCCEEHTRTLIIDLNRYFLDFTEKFPELFRDLIPLKKILITILILKISDLNTYLRTIHLMYRNCNLRIWLKTDIALQNKRKFYLKEFKITEDQLNSKFLSDLFFSQLKIYKTKMKMPFFKILHDYKVMSDLIPNPYIKMSINIEDCDIYKKTIEDYIKNKNI